MHPEDMMCLGIALVVFSVFAAVLVALGIYYRRKRARVRVEFEQACAALGLTNRDDRWYGERFGVTVSVAWVARGTGSRQRTNLVELTEYVAHFDPPLKTEALFYTGGVDVWGGGFEKKQVHISPVQYWNRMALPGGGVLLDVLNAPEKTTLKHANVDDEALKEAACIYGRSFEATNARFTGALAEFVVMLAGATNYTWFDDTQLILLLRGEAKKGFVISSSTGDIDLLHRDGQQIDGWLKKTATFANEMRRLTA